MNRAGLSIIVLVAALATGCAGSDEAGTSPTAPSAPAPPSTPPPPTPPPNNSCKPPAPTGLSVTLTGSSNRVFTWNASAGAVDYFIQIGSVSGASDFVNTNTSQTTYSWNGQSQGPLYYARVYARNSCGSGNTSPEISFH